MRISEIALKLAVPRHYIDYWRRTGLLSDAAPGLAFQDLRKIQFIALARSRGISLQKIRSTIAGGPPVGDEEAWYRDLLVQSGQLLRRDRGPALYQPETGQYFFNYENRTERAVIDLAGRLESPEAEVGLLEKQFQAALEAGDEEAMEAALVEILKREPDHMGALIERGNIAFEMGEYEDAIRFYEATLEHDPYCVEAIYNLANIYFRQKKNAVAIRYFLQCIELDPDFPESYYNLGIVYYSLNLLDRARICFETYVSLDPDSTWTRQARGFLDDIEVSLASGMRQSQLFSIEPGSASRSSGPVESMDEGIQDLFRDRSPPPGKEPAPAQKKGNEQIQLPAPGAEQPLDD